MENNIDPENIVPPEYESGFHAKSAVSQRVAIPKSVFLDWADRTPLENVLPGTKRIPAVVRTEPILGDFPSPGSIRRVVLADGNHALEIVHKKNDDIFEYQVWGFSSAPFIKYARCAFHYSIDDGGCMIEWSYQFRPTSLVYYPLVFVFAKAIFANFMKQSIETIRQLSEASCNE